MFAIGNGAPDQAVGPVEAADVNVSSPDQLAQVLRKVPIGTRPAAEQVEAECPIFGKRMAGKVGFRQHADAGDAARVRKRVPLRRGTRMQIQIADQLREQTLQGREIAQAIRAAAVGFDDPFDTGHVRGARRGEF